MAEKKERRPQHERNGARALMKTLNCNYTTALREYLRLEKEKTRALAE